jgi:hypothetical protein
MSSIPQPISQSPILLDPAAPAYKLFDPTAVSLATFFGTPVAGATLMFVNDRRMHRTTGSSIILLGSIVVTGAIILLAWNIPQAVSSVFAILLVIAMRYVAAAFQGKAIAEHVARGGKLASKWAAFGVGVIFLVVIFLVAFVVIFRQTKASEGTKVVIGTKDEVYFKGTATQAEAIALGNELKADGYFTDRGVTVMLDKAPTGPTVSFVTKEGAWDQPDMVASFDEIGREVAPSVGGFPLHLRLLNKQFDVKKESNVGKLTVGNDHIYYFGTATDAQAKALGDALKSAGFFEGKGADVFLSKQTDGTTLSFVVGDGVWNDASLVATFEKIVRDAAPSIGGLPIHLHLENTSLEVKKDEPIN